MGHNGADQAKDRIELREGGVDEGVGEDVVALGHADDTVGADLALADGGEQAGGADGDADTEAEGAGDDAVGELAEQDEDPSSGTLLFYNIINGLSNVFGTKNPLF